ncbi:MAG: hypothetical protein GX147_08405 [Deltaproteobacteria bacterium]|nr:hypothetical protein [Deltaproteobacteria bacterium]
MSRLSLKFYKDDWVARPSNTTANENLIHYIANSARLSGYATVRDLARAFGFKNPNKVTNALQIFFSTSEIHDSYMKKLVEILDLDPQKIEEINSQHRDALFKDQRLFVQHFDALYAKADFIISHERFRNIIFFGMNFESLWVGRHRPLSLGELFFHWKENRLVTDSACCGLLYIFQAAGSPLSGANSVTGYCDSCKQIISTKLPSFSAILHPLLNNPPPWPYAVVDDSMQDLVQELNL